MGNRNKKIFLIAGENSGDLHGANLVRNLKELDPDLEFIGLGGNQLKQAGVKLIENIVSSLAIVGFVEVVRKLHKIHRLFRKVKRTLKTERPAAVILIDYPGFNLRVARMAKEMGIMVFYYISPHVWAWGRGRIRKIAKYVDKMLVILPFEESIYKAAGVDVAYVGHPLLDVMKLSMTREQVFQRFGFDLSRMLFGLLPGSRKPEIERLLPVMLEAAETIKHKIPQIQFVIPRASTIKKELINYYLINTPLQITVVDQQRYNVRSAMDFAIVASGTAALETALLGCPMIIIYKTSFLSWAIAKSLVNLPYVGLVNIVAGEMVVPELLQNEATPQNIADKALQLLSDPESLENIKYQMAKVKEKIGSPGASRCAAIHILEALNKRARPITSTPV